MAVKIRTDVATRGISVNKLKENSLCWTGPMWLKQMEINYCEKDLEPHEDDLVKENLSVVETNLASSESPTKMELLDLKNYSDIKQVLHVTSVRIFSNNARVKKYKVKPAQQISAPLREERIEQGPSFEITGVDFAGPLYCRSHDKVYIALFTCAVTRAIHLE